MSELASTQDDRTANSHPYETTRFQVPDELIDPLLLDDPIPRTPLPITAYDGAQDQPHETDSTAISMKKSEGQGETATAEEAVAPSAAEQSAQTLLPGSPVVKPEYGAMPDAPSTSLNLAPNMDQASPAAICASVEGPEMAVLPKLEKIVTHGSTEHLDAAIRCATRLLHVVEMRLSDIKDASQAQHYLTLIATLQHRAKSSRAIIGVVGNTGAGKSSLINAVLDTKKLLPTNCYRACTAVATEIMWNDSKDPAEKYRAEVEFVKSHEWYKELDVLFSELLTADGKISSDYTNPDTEAGIANAKVQAVYPQLTKTKEMLAKCCAEALMDVPEVCEVLDTMATITAATEEDFRVKLEQYLDGKDRIVGERQADAAIAYWPLIRVVRVFVKAEALSTGTIIVDLPGVQDANAARSAVADRYLLQCSGLWIVSPINRAVDDKAAKTLLGDSFKRQIMMDGSLSNMSFICTKTDDISIDETADSMDGGRAAARDFDERCSSLGHKLKEVEAKFKQTEDQGQALKKEKKALDKEIAKLQKFHDGFGEAPKLPVPHGLRELKRKRAKQRNQRPKKRGPARGAFLDSSEEDDSELEDSEDSYMTVEEVQAELSERQSRRSEASEALAKATADYLRLEDEVKHLQADKAASETEKAAYFLRRRSEHSKGAIQIDFAAGIKEFDEQSAMQKAAGEVDPDVDCRDYEAVALGLPVFCVSSRAYQQLCGRSCDEVKIQGIRNLHETQIPQLQQHAKNVNVQDRTAHSTACLNDLASLLSSLAIWLNSDSVSSSFYTVLDAKRGVRELELVNAMLADLDKQFEAAATVAWHKMGITLETRLYSKFTAATNKARKVAPDLVKRYIHPQPAGFGIKLASLRSICKNNGSSTRPRGRSFNEDLLEPFLQVIANGWDGAFTEIDQHLQECTRTMTKHVETFWIKTKKRQQMAGGCNPACIALLSQKSTTSARVIKDMAQDLGHTIASAQRELNRGNSQHIQKYLTPTYTECCKLTGKGVFVEIQNLLRAGANSLPPRVFKKAGADMKDKLTEMIGELKEDSIVRGREIVANIRADFQAAIIGYEHAQTTRVVQSHIREEIRTMDEDITRIVSQMNIDESKMDTMDESPDVPFST